MNLNQKERSLIRRTVFSQVKKDKVLAIILFGSRARGDYTSDSDYDINVYLKNKNKKLWRIDSRRLRDNYHINIVDSALFEGMKQEAHPFIYCSFRDGIPLYQKEEWFNKTKEEILTLEPSKETSKYYFSKGLEGLNHLRWEVQQDIKFRLPLNELEYEDGKVVANQIGFGFVMFHKKYPLSHYTLKKDIIGIDKKYKPLGNTVDFLHKSYYGNKKQNAREFVGNINFLYNFASKFVKRHFPKEYRTIKAYEKVLYSIKRK